MDDFAPGSDFTPNPGHAPVSRTKQLLQIGRYFVSRGADGAMCVFSNESIGKFVAPAADSALAGRSLVFNIRRPESVSLLKQYPSQRKRYIDVDEETYNLKVVLARSSEMASA